MIVSVEPFTHNISPGVFVWIISINPHIVTMNKHSDTPG